MLRADAVGLRALLTAGPVGCLALAAGGVLIGPSSAGTTSPAGPSLPLTSPMHPAPSSSGSWSMSRAAGLTTLGAAAAPWPRRGLARGSSPAAAALTGRDDTCRRPAS